MRSGRATAGLLDRIHVDYYGTSTPLKQMANISAPGVAAALHHAVRQDRDEGHREGDHGERPRAQPDQRRQVIRLPIPALTEERRRDLVKVVHHLAEEGRVAVRNVRRDA